MIKPSNLCTGCGACQAVCYSGAISMRLSAEGVYRPHIDKFKCKNCLLCEKVCPNLSGNKKITKGIGNFGHCYIGYATDQTLRLSASSGGIATTFVRSLFKRNLIGGEITLEIENETPLKPKLILATRTEEINSKISSRYCPVMPSFKIKELLAVPGKIVVVGLPCHIHAFRNLEAIDKRLKNKFIKIGLFCGRCPNMHATEFFLKQKSIKTTDVFRIAYRGEGWPGKFSVQTKRGSRFYASLSDWCNFSYFPFFIPVSCALCNDLSNQLADITLGDAWGLSKDQIGTSIIITRTDLGQKVLEEILDKGEIVLQDVSVDKISKGQGLDGKVRNSLIRAFIWEKIFKQKVPLETIGLKNIAPKEWVMNLLYCTILYCSQNTYLRVAICNTTVYFAKHIRRSKN